MDTNSYIAFLVISALLVVIDAVVVTVSGRKYLSDDDRLHQGANVSVVVIGVGNEFRRDDGVGPAVARALAASGIRAEISDGDPVRLMEAWDGAEALDRRPQQLVIYAVEVADVGFGTSLSPAVEAAVVPLTAAVLTEVTTEFPMPGH